LSTLYWWSRFGYFTPGEGILPHMGEVIAEYRQRRGLKTQADLAIAAGVLPRSVTDWESKAVLRDFQRRVFLAKLLNIPPALLGLDWRTVVYEDNTGNHSHPLLSTDEAWLEDSYYHYEDSNTMSLNLARILIRSSLPVSVFLCPDSQRIAVIPKNSIISRFSL
jgi:transcriptional regulator with XRE-family HTH domain